LSIWAIIPVRPLEEGKSRLAPVLGPVERRCLNETLFRRTVQACCLAVGPAATLVVSRSVRALRMAEAEGARTLLETAPHGLNEALSQAAATARRWGATAALSVSCDLPFLTADDLRALIATAAAGGGLAIGADRALTGTNALFVSPVGAIAYRYGADSLRAHRDAARRSGLALPVVRRTGLAFDLDTPDDVREMAALDRLAMTDAPRQGGVHDCG
jgi:2-phospho-L-lactate guanylyltransferase